MFFRICILPEVLQSIGSWSGASDWYGTTSHLRLLPFFHVLLKKLFTLYTGKLRGRRTVVWGLQA